MVRGAILNVRNILVFVALLAIGAVLLFQQAPPSPQGSGSPQGAFDNLPQALGGTAKPTVLPSGIDKASVFALLKDSSKFFEIVSEEKAKNRPATNVIARGQGWVAFPGRQLQYAANEQYIAGGNLSYDNVRCSIPFDSALVSIARITKKPSGELGIECEEGPAYGLSNATAKTPSGEDVAMLFGKISSCSPKTAQLIDALLHESAPAEKYAIDVPVVISNTADFYRKCAVSTKLVNNLRDNLVPKVPDLLEDYYVVSFACNAIMPQDAQYEKYSPCFAGSLDFGKQPVVSGPLFVVVPAHDKVYP